MTHQENLKKTQEWEEPQPLREDWIIKSHAPDGDIKEATFGSQDEARALALALLAAADHAEKAAAHTQKEETNG